MASDVSSFKDTVTSCLNDLRADELVTLLSDPENEKTVSQIGCRLLSLVFDHLKENPIEDNSLHVYGEALQHIVEKSAPKDLYLALLELFDPMVELNLIMILFPALNHVCRRILEMDKKSHCFNLGLCFSSLVYYGEGLNIPSYENYQPTENCALSFDEMKIVRYLSECLKVGELIMEDLGSQLEETLIHEAHFKAAKDEVMIFCCGLLERISLLNLHLHSEENDENKKASNHSGADTTEDLLGLVKRIVTFTLSLHSSWVLLQDLTWKRFVDTGRDMSPDECAKVDAARACLLYLTLVEGCGYFPQTVDPYYAFYHCFPSVLSLIQSDNPTTVHKGLELCRFVSNRLNPLSLRCGEISEILKSSRVRNPAFSLLRAAVNVATQCATKILRQRAAQFLTRFINKFVWIDRHILLYRLLTTVEHCGVVGYLIVYIKDKLSEILQEPSPPMSEAFVRRANIDKLFDICLDLPNGSETDLISEYDKIMASLNLLRFLLIRDKQNKTGIYDRLASVEENYLNALRTGINLSRMHFRDELKKQSSPKPDTHSASTDFTINGVSMPSIPRKSRIKMLESAIHSFDMMQTVCIRVQELVDDVKSRRQ